MIKRSLLTALVLSIASGLAVSSQADASTTVPRPNIILVFIDDMGWGDFSCFGNTEVKTPNIDALAEEGIRFHQFYVNSPICSPSRVAISTGQYPQRWRITSYLNNREDNAKRGVADWLDPKAPMLARYLKEAGYATGHFGKWHMGGQRDVDDAPPITAYGFDESLTNFEGMGAKLLPLTEKPLENGKVKKGRIWGKAEILGEPVEWKLRCEITGGFVERAVGFIDQAQKERKPFYINLWPDDVHKPFFPKLENWADTQRGLYLSVLEEMDAQLAPLFDRIRDDPALRDNTLVFICSDNGPDLDCGSAEPFKGLKATLFEGGVRSPLIVWSPGFTEPAMRGAVNKEAVLCAMDLLPSVLQVAGIDQPEDVEFDGIPMAGTFLGKSKASRSEPLFFRRPPDRKDFRTFKQLPDLAMRDGKWKFLCDYDGGRPLLFDLDADPAESRNIAHSNPELVERMAAAIMKWNAGLPKDAGAPDDGRAEIEAGLKSHNRALFIKEGWIRDPYIVLGPDDLYYLTGTTMNPGDPREESDPYNSGLGKDSAVGNVVQIWCSPDLIEWEYLGTPFTLKDSFFKKNPGNRIWAPEVHWIPEMKRWALVHCPKQKANLALSAGASLNGPWTHPVGKNLGQKHDPSLFKDDDTWWLLWDNTQIAPLNEDFTDFTASPKRIDPVGSRTNAQGKKVSVIGHEGATIRKIGDKYVHFGTAWSTDLMRKGSYNMYYCTADKIDGPYGPRKFVGRFLGHGTPFQTRDGKWWCTAFYNADVPPLDRKGIETKDLGETAQTINQRGTTIVPLEVKIQDDGDIYIRAKDPAYATPGPDESQRFFPRVEIGGIVPKPIFADPNYHGSCDPEVVWNDHAKEWWVFYTARRATREKGSYVGTPIGVVASKDLVHWQFKGYCSFDGVPGKPDMPVTFWAPGIIRAGDTYHMFVTYKDNTNPPWGGKGVIRHYKADGSDLLNGWKLVGVPSFNQPDPIDASLIKVEDGFRAYYRVGKGGGIQWAASKDLQLWENKGKCKGAVNAKERGFGYQEAPYVFRFKNHFWMLTDPHKGLAVFKSKDGVNWTQQERILEKPGTGAQDATLARHPSVAVINGRAFLFYHTEPNRPYPTPKAEDRTPEQKISFLQIAELRVKGGQLVCDRDQHVVSPVEDLEVEPVEGRWSVEKANDWFDKQPWLVGANFVPSSAINQLEMWQAETFDPEAIDRELGWAVSIGMNTMRVFLHDICWSEDRAGFFSRIDQYLEIADRHGIKTMFVLFDGVWHPLPKAGKQPDPIPRTHNSGWVQSPGKIILNDPAKQDELKEYVQDVIRRYKADPRVLIWDLFNEPDNANAGKWGGSAAEELPTPLKRYRATELAETTFVWAREVNPSQPLTVGVWGNPKWFRNPSRLELVSLRNSDILSFHTYHNAEKAKPVVEQVAAQDRPALCTEYMARGNGSTFEGILPQFKEHKIGAYCWGLVDGKSQTIYPWDSWKKKYTAEPEPWFHDVFRRDGTPYKQSEVDFIKSITAAPKPNVLMILVDDLKPEFGVYGADYVVSPNLDRLAARGMRFDRAYCNQAVCAPSRNNLMIGLRSTTTGLYGLSQGFRSVVPDAVTLTQYFMKHGYTAEGVGKVFHIGHGNKGDDASWSLPFHKDKVVDYVLEESTGGQLTREEAYFSNAGVKVRDLPRGAAWEKADVPDDAYADGRIALEGIKRLQKYKKSGEPFFLALGFTKPHLPCNAPAKYWDLYDPSVFKLTARDTLPDGAPKYAGKNPKGEIANYKPVPESGVGKDKELARKLIHAYFASLSYMDAQLGKVIDELDRLGMADDTVIMLWGDHGWHFGDHGTWTKHTNYEQDNRIPLIFVAPGITEPGSSTGTFAETVDVFPTLAELAGLPAPTVPQGLDGMSLVPVLKDSNKSVRNHAYHAFNRGQRIGRAIRTERYRMVEWKKAGAPNDTAEYELYDYKVDKLEQKNVAKSNPEVLATIKAILSKHPEASAPGGRKKKAKK